MYWVNRKILRNTLRSPFNPKKLMSAGKVNEIFSEIYKKYTDRYENSWTKGSMPLNYFLDEFVKATGADRNALEESIIKYIKANEVIDLTLGKEISA